MRKPKSITLLDEQPSISFEILRSYGILQPKLIGSYYPLSLVFDSKRHCAFYFGMSGYDVNECCQLRRDIDNLIRNKGSKETSPSIDMVSISKNHSNIKLCPSLFSQIDHKTSSSNYLVPPSLISPTSKYIPVSYQNPPINQQSNKTSRPQAIFQKNPLRQYTHLDDPWSNFMRD